VAGLNCCCDTANDRDPEASLVDVDLEGDMVAEAGCDKADVLDIVLVWWKVERLGEFRLRILWAEWRRGRSKVTLGRRHSTEKRRRFGKIVQLLPATRLLSYLVIVYPLITSKLSSGTVLLYWEPEF
jgi:hypothetical protein